MTNDLVFPAAGVVERLELGGWTLNPAGRPGVLALNSGHYFADGDGVTVLLRMSGADALVGDGGTMKIRLADAKVDMTAERARQAWESTLRDFGLHEVDDRIVGRKPADQLPSLLTDIVDAMLTLDGLKVLAKRAQASRLERQLYTFLDELVDTKRVRFERHPQVLMPAGAKIRPTARVETPQRDVYVQTATKDTIDRAMFFAAALKQTAFDVDQRLVVLRGRKVDWPQDYLNMIENDARIGFMDETFDLRRILVST